MKNALMLAALTLLAVSLLYCDSGRSDYRENEYFRCEFQADDPHRHINRREGIPFTLKCVSRKDRVEFSFISINVYRETRTRREIPSPLRSDKNKYKKYSREHVPSVTSTKNEKLSGDYIVTKKVTVTPEQPLIINGVFKHHSRNNLYYNNRYLFVYGTINYPDDPLVVSKEWDKVREDRKKNWRKYSLSIYQDID